MATIKSKVLQILGENNATYFDNVINPEYVVETAVWGMASAVPRRVLLSDTTEPVDPENIPEDPGAGSWLDTQSSPVNVENKIVLLVTRTQTDYTVDGASITAYNYITRPCKEIPYEDAFKAKDGTSIYYATNYSPVYWLENTS